MTLLYYDPRFLRHDTGQHPERPDRLVHIMAALDAQRLAARCQRPTWEGADDARLATVHMRSHIELLERLDTRGGGLIDSDTVVSPGSVDVARLAAGATCDAVRRVMAGEAKHALCVARPPGHHAIATRAMGFCLLNNVALAARQALDAGAERVLVVDWDVHHGNGTQAMFYDDPRVGFFSVHRWPFYPGTGSEEETGKGDGLGTTRNLPLPFGTTPREYQEAVASELEDFTARIRPELVLVSAGFDAHRADPIGSLGLEVEDFVTLTRLVVQIAESYAQGRVVSALEGGYNPPVLGECVAAHLEQLLQE